MGVGNKQAPKTTSFTLSESKDAGSLYSMEGQWAGCQSIVCVCAYQLDLQNCIRFPL